MTDNDPGLVLHVPFSDGLGVGPIDRSAKRHEVRVIGRPLLVADPTLGAAHRFKAGDYVQVNGLDLGTPAFTASLWARREAAEERVQLLALGATGQGQLNLYLWPEGIPELYLEYPDGGVRAQLFDSLLPRGDWAHLALTFDGETLKLWQDGRQLSPDVPVPGFELRTRMLTLSSPSEAAGPPFLGGLAQLRLHDTALEGQAIRARHAADRGLRASYLDSHPILLSLLDGNDAASLYITDHPSGEALTLEFANVAGRPVRLLPLFDDLGRDNCHFELRFRPGTLAKSAITPGPHALALADAEDWVMSAPERRSDGTIAFYLGHRTPGHEPVTIPADARIGLALSNARADPAGGARNARIELRYGQISLGDSTTLLHGSRISHVSILSHVGRHNLPLHVGFIGPNTIFPGTDVEDEGNEIRLRLTNTSPDLPILWAPGNPEHGPASYLELTFDYEAPGEEKDWALCRLTEAPTAIDTPHQPNGPLIGVHSEARVQRRETAQGVFNVLVLEEPPPQSLKDGQRVIYQITIGKPLEARIVAVRGLPANEIVLDRFVTYQRGATLHIAKPRFTWSRSQATRPSWKIWSDEATHIVPGDHIEVVVRGIVTTLPPGPANLYLKYRNIPGYQGGHITAQLEKSFVIVKQDRIGIGRNNPNFTLHLTDEPSDENAGSVFIGPREKVSGKSNANLRLGHAGDYTYIQSQGGLRGANGLRINAKNYQDVLLGSAEHPNHVGVGVDRAIAQLDVGGGHILLRAKRLTTMEIEKIMRDAGEDDLLIVGPHGNNRKVTFYWVERGVPGRPLLRGLYSAELQLDAKLERANI